MYQCNQCGVTVKTAATRCPLCHGLLDGGPAGTERSYPACSPRKTRRFWTEFGVIAAIMGFHVLLNLFVSPQVLWSIPFCATVAYSWLLVALDRKGVLRHGITWTYHLLPITALLMLYNLYTNGGGPALSWFPTYGIAFCIALSLLINYGWFFLSRRSALDVLPSQLIISIAGLIPVLLVVLRVIAFTWACVGTAVLSVATLLFILLAYRTKTRTMLQSYFHVL